MDPITTEFDEFSFIDLEEEGYQTQPEEFLKEFGYYEDDGYCTQPDGILSHSDTLSTESENTAVTNKDVEGNEIRYYEDNGYITQPDAIQSSYDGFISSYDSETLSTESENTTAVIAKSFDEFSVRDDDVVGAGQIDKGDALSTESDNLVVTTAVEEILEQSGHDAVIGATQKPDLAAVALECPYCQTPISCWKKLEKHIKRNKCKKLKQVQKSLETECNTSGSVVYIYPAASFQASKKVQKSPQTDCNTSGALLEVPGDEKLKTGSYRCDLCHSDPMNSKAELRQHLKEGCEVLKERNSKAVCLVEEEDSSKKSNPNASSVALEDLIVNTAAAVVGAEQIDKSDIISPESENMVNTTAVEENFELAGDDVVVGAEQTHLGDMSIQSENIITTKSAGFEVKALQCPICGARMSSRKKYIIHMKRNKCKKSNRVQKSLETECSTSGSVVYVIPAASFQAFKKVQKPFETECNISGAHLEVSGEEKPESITIAEDLIVNTAGAGAEQITDTISTESENIVVTTLSVEGSLQKPDKIAGVELRDLVCPFCDAPMSCQKQLDTHLARRKCKMQG